MRIITHLFKNEEKRHECGVIRQDIAYGSLELFFAPSSDYLMVCCYIVHPAKKPTQAKFLKPTGQGFVRIPRVKRSVYEDWICLSCSRLTRE